MDEILQKAGEVWQYIQDKPDIVQAITSIFPVIGGAGAVILAFVKWGLPQISRLRHRPASHKALTEFFPFDVIHPPQQVADVQKRDFLRCLLGSLEPVDYPLADFNIPYQQRDPDRDVLGELERCFSQKNWVLILGKSGLGKTREAAELALQLHAQGWTILRLTMEGKWLERPLRFPSEKVPGRRLLFFLDNLNQPMYASRVREGKTEEGLSDELLRKPLQERLLEYLVFFERECGVEQVRVIATARNEQAAERSGEPSPWDKLAWTKHPQFWARFSTYSLPDLASASMIKVLQEALDQGKVQAQSADFLAIANHNDGTFRNVVANLQEVRKNKGLLTFNTFKPTLTGSWKERFTRVRERYPLAVAVYSAADLLRQVDIDLRAVENRNLQQTLLLETAMLFVVGWWQRWQLARTLPKVLAMEQRLLDPPDGLLEAKGIPTEVGIYLPPLRRLLLKQAKKQPWGMIWLLHGFAFVAYRLERYREALPVFRTLLDELLVPLTMQHQEPGQEKALQDFLAPIWFSRGTSAGLLGLGLKAETTSTPNPTIEDKFLEAIASYDKALQLNPVNDSAWYNRGVALSNLGCHEDEIDSYDKALQLNPDKDSAWYNRGNALDKLGRHEDAIDSYDKALQLRPDNDSAWYNRGVVLDKLGRHEDAIGSYDKALQLKPDNDSAWSNRGVALGKLGRHEEAIASFDKALQLNPINDSAWYNRGVALSNLGCHEEAIASYDKALQLNPDNDSAWSNRGVALDNLGRHEEAIDSFDKSLQLRPDDDSAWSNRGVALGKLGRHEDEINSYDKAHEIKPDDPNTFYNKACCYALQNNLEDAIANLSRAIALSPDEYREMAKTDSDFDAIRDNEQFQALISG
jgi:tetratricopeptide (TPR) repeat protein